MRVTASGEGAPTHAAEARRSTRTFGDALARARRPSARTGPSPAPVPELRVAADRGAVVLGDRRRGFRSSQEGADEVRGETLARTSPAAVPVSSPGAPVGPAAPALRAAIRAVPAAVEARLGSGTAAVELTFGRALTVEVRRGRDGLHLVLRPAADHARAAAGELPSLVAALRSRGLAVAGATVRPLAAAAPLAR